jgi:hypothetical protein
MLPFYNVKFQSAVQIELHTNLDEDYLKDF